MPAIWILELNTDRRAVLCLYIELIQSSLVSVAVHGTMQWHSIRGLPYMTSTKFSDFFTPSSPCHCHKQAWDLWCLVWWIRVQICVFSAQCMWGERNISPNPASKIPPLVTNQLIFSFHLLFLVIPLPHPLRTSYMEAPLDASLSEQWRIVQCSGVCKQ